MKISRRSCAQPMRRRHGRGLSVGWAATTNSSDAVWLIPTTSRDAVPMSANVATDNDCQHRNRIAHFHRALSVPSRLEYEHGSRLFAHESCYRSSSS